MSGNTKVREHKMVTIRKGPYGNDGDLGTQIEIALCHILGGAVMLFNKEVEGDYEVWTGVLATDITSDELLHKAAETAYRLFPFSSWKNYEVNKNEESFSIGKVVEIEA